MKILFIGIDPTTTGGVQTFTKNIASFVDNNVGYIPSFISSNTKTNKNVISLLPASIIAKIFLRILRLLQLDSKLFNLLLSRKIRQEHYNLIILNTPQTLKLLTSIQIPIVLVQHQTFDTYIKRSDYFNAELKLIDLVKKRLTKLVVLSPLDREEFIKKLNIEESKLCAIRHTTNLEILTSNKIENHKLLILCRIDNKHKRLDLAVKAMKLLPTYELSIYGDGPDKEYIQGVIDSEKITNVTLYPSNNDIKEILDNHSIHIMTSDFEGYPLANIEAMRRGLPLIIRNTFTSAKDIIENNGVLLDSNWSDKEFCDAVTLITANFSIYSNNALSMSKKYDYEVIKNKWLTLFDEIVTREIN
ncbi:glycosyltransferase [Shewanella benthica]|uniref:Glycosyltransferase n=1 Tax=Shewanella benthica KT99 TaxID=314608 RepID=A9D4J8_9GAMM|nr:glycosyltransferase [Shewanella benthica]EDQ01569.1 glycosyltransferase [Shewanella benthica KT99]